MKCDLCDGAVRTRTATIGKPYPYTFGGLKDVCLAGITVRECKECHAESPVIPRIAELQTVIAEGLIKKPTCLTGDEIRFLRKQAGFPANKFAAMLGIEPTYLSKIENGHLKNFGDATDKLARAIVMVANEEEDLREMLLREAVHKQSRQRVRARMKFKLVRNRWLSAA